MANLKSNSIINVVNLVFSHKNRFYDGTLNLRNDRFLEIGLIYYTILQDNKY
jgi:hypothetical protein